MRYQITSVAGALLAVVLLFGCDREEFPTTPVGQSQPSPQVSSDPANVGSDTSAPPFPVVNVIVNPILLWPPAASPREEVIIATDLFADNYYVVLDGSGSMDGTKCSGGKSKSAVAKEALIEFAGSVPVLANLGLVIFDKSGSAVEERVPLGLDNRDVFIQKVMESRTNSGTPLHNAVVRGYKALLAQGRRQLGYGAYYLIILTDGEPDAGQDPRSAVDQIVNNSPVVVITIGFCIGKNHALNQPGRTVYKEANNPAEVKAGFAAVLAESAEFSAIQVPGKK